jgi:hypothetical protein
MVVVTTPNAWYDDMIFTKYVAYGRNSFTDKSRLN